MNKKSRPVVFGMLAGLTLLGLGIGYEEMWCDQVEAALARQEDNRLVRDGIAVDFELRPLVAGAALIEGSYARVSFKITDQTSGQPLSGVSPGAWLDPALEDEAVRDRDKSCKSRVALFLRSSIGARPLMDLNSYFLLVLNKDASLSVIDPTVSVGGTTSTMARIDLPRPPMDWVSSDDDKRVFVSMPEAGEVAVIDTDKFQLVGTIAAGKQPVRVALQPDGRLLWVGNNDQDLAHSGVSLIDTNSLKPVGFIATGPGHHEIAFSKDSQLAFVSNRDSGTLSVIDTASRILRKSLKTGSNPLSVAVSKLSQAAYVADGKDGTITVVDASSLEVRSVIQAQQGLGPMRFSHDGRFGVALNTLTNQALVIDAATDKVIHQLDVSAEPYQVTFTQAYAYIRGLASPKVTMVNLSSLGEGRQPIVQGFDAGPAAPRQAGDLPLAQGLVPARDDNAVFVVNPVDNTTYFYTEGMNAPMSGYLNRGHVARAALVVDRSLREVSPGVYSSTLKLPAAGRFDVAFLLNQPQIIHCFSTQVEQRSGAIPAGAPRLEFLKDHAPLTAGQPYTLRFKVLQGQGEPRAGLKDLTVRYYLAPSSRAREIPVREVSEGLYEAPLELAQSGAWYVHVRSPSLGNSLGDKAFASLRVVPAQAAR
ncbi:YncE family protein [Pseudomonas sp. R5(2019)]|uniref:YncE family protein n=1 Tax=Pseudomonas sp. R5(2019) TaxID=2697566 RepID=UPI001412DC68|nr:cytochrome D1 domain-containing protein [Pseudomonas sp. R5(2019)]NBA96742.1 cytochrome D1 [Pseudomonas sp. R5(2019)]